MFFTHILLSYIQPYNNSMSINITVLLIIITCLCRHGNSVCNYSNAHAFCYKPQQQSANRSKVKHKTVRLKGLFTPTIEFLITIATVSE